MEIIVEVRNPETGQLNFNIHFYIDFLGSDGLPASHEKYAIIDARIYITLPYEIMNRRYAEQFSVAKIEKEIKNYFFQDDEGSVTKEEVKSYLYSLQLDKRILALEGIEDLFLPKQMLTRLDVLGQIDKYRGADFFQTKNYENGFFKIDYQAIKKRKGVVFMPWLDSWTRLFVQDVINETLKEQNPRELSVVEMLNKAKNLCHTAIETFINNKDKIEKIVEFSFYGVDQMAVYYKGDVYAVVELQNEN